MDGGYVKVEQAELVGTKSAGSASQARLSLSPSAGTWRALIGPTGFRAALIKRNTRPIVPSYIPPLL